MADGGIGGGGRSRKMTFSDIRKKSWQIYKGFEVRVLIPMFSLTFSRGSEES